MPQALWPTINVHVTDSCQQFKRLKDSRLTPMEMLLSGSGLTPSFVHAVISIVYPSNSKFLRPTTAVRGPTAAVVGLKSFYCWGQ